MIKDITFVNEEELLKWDARCARAAQEYSEHMYAQKLYEGLCKDFLAALKVELLDKYPEASQTELETRARASEQWRTFRAEEMDKLRTAGAAQIRFDNARRRWETCRSIISLKKKEMERG